MRHYFENKFKFLNTYFFRCNYSSFFKPGLLQEKKYRNVENCWQINIFHFTGKTNIFSTFILQLVLSRHPRISLEASSATTDRHLTLENKEIRLPKITCCKIWGTIKNDHLHKISIFATASYSNNEEKMTGTQY